MSNASDSDDAADLLSAPAVDPPTARHPVAEASPADLDLEAFVVKHLLPCTPVVVRGAAADSPAVRKWCHRSFWRATAGNRTVPVEQDFHEANHRLQTIDEYLDQLRHGPRPGYIAQHTLLDQMPHLAHDLPVPDVVLGPPRRHVFFGPSGTVSPLHTDPYHNAFVQVVGFKYIRLVAPEHSAAIPMCDGALRNIAALPTSDLLLADDDPGALPPNFRVVPYLDVVLGPGDVLFLPVGWWHFVKSLSVSVSVAFHFDPE